MAEPSGAIDNDWESAERSAEEVLREGIADLPTEPEVSGVALDLVTRQPLYIVGITADSLTNYYEKEEFDLYSYKTHPYLPVSLTDTVYECAFIGTDPESAHKPGRTYDFPRGRLMTVPVGLAGDEDA